MTATRSLKRQIHLACRQLGLDPDTRHALQHEVTGKASLTEMTEPELRLVVEALEKRGFKSGFKGASKSRRAPAPRADLRYVHVLWGLLGKAGVLDRPDRDGLNAFVRSRFEAHWSMVPIDIDALRDADQISDVIRALQAFARRHGVKVERGRHDR